MTTTPTTDLSQEEEDPADEEEEVHDDEDDDEDDDGDDSTALAVSSPLILLVTVVAILYRTATVLLGGGLQTTLQTAAAPPPATTPSMTTMTMTSSSSSWLYPPSSESSSSVYLLAVIVTIVVAAVVIIAAWIFYPAYVVWKDGNGLVASTEEVLTGRASADATTPPMLTLVIPAYNEQTRLPIMLDATLEHLRTNRRDIVAQCRAVLEPSESGSVVGGGDDDNDDAHHENGGARHHYSSSGAAASPSQPGGGASDTIEIIIVSDGSTDATPSIVRSYTDTVIRCHPSHNDILKLVTLCHNSGKGAAVRAGMMRSTGLLCLMVDADGATDLTTGLGRVLHAMGAEVDDVRAQRMSSGTNAQLRGRDGRFLSKSEREELRSQLGPVAVLGSRAHLEDASTATRSLSRTVLMHAFHLCVRILCTSRIRDTQCGFKLFTRPAVLELFGELHLRRWAFDTELVVRAERTGVRLVEVGVDWHEVGGSKIDESRWALARNSLGMLRDMVCVRACYAVGIWKLKRTR